MDHKAGMKLVKTQNRKSVRVESKSENAVSGKQSKNVQTFPQCELVRIRRVIIGILP